MKAIEITAALNGYPEHLHRGYIGFKTFEEAENFAKKYDGEVVELRRRDGWQLWVNRGRIYEPLKVDAETYGDDFRTVSSVEEWEDDCHDTLVALLDDSADLEEISANVSNMKDILEKVRGLDENEAVLLCCGEFYDIIKTKTMSYHEDVWYHEVGVSIDGYNDEADAECEF